MSMDQEETTYEDVIEPTSATEGWLEEQVRLLTLEEGPAQDVA